MTEKQKKRVLLIICGGVAAYKSLELIRLLRKKNMCVTTVMTEGAQHFITPLSVSSLSEEHVYTDLWSLKDETEMGHIRLSRQADIILCAPATANFMAKIASGLADDLASATTLAADKKLMLAPSMNVRMWENPATQRNLDTIIKDGHNVLYPENGEMACGEYGEGRMMEPEGILRQVEACLNGGPLSGKTVLVTSGPTYEPIDPVRYIANRSSGKQGHLIASVFAQMGARVTLVTGPTGLKDPIGVTTIHVETAEQMRQACEEGLPAHVAIFAAAVADWKPAKYESSKLKKTGSNDTEILKLARTKDIFGDISGNESKRPDLVIGFAAETDHLENNAIEKLKQKNADAILANNVQVQSVFGKDDTNIVFIYKEKGSSDKTSINKKNWGVVSKQDVAYKLAEYIINNFRDV